MRCRWAMVALLALAACSSDSDNVNTIPTLAWGNFRHDSTNGALGNGIARNSGEVTLFLADVAGSTISTPAIDNNGNVFIGTATGLVSINDRGDLRWSIDTCQPEGGVAVPIGPISSSPTVTPGRNIIVGSDATLTAPGMVFAFEEKSNDRIECLWAFTPAGAGASITSSPQAQVDSLDLSLLSVFIGTGGGALQAINGVGTPRWTFAPSGDTRPITSSNAVDPTGPFYITTPDGLLAAVDASGRPLWQFPIGAPPTTALQASPAVNVSIYAIGGGSALYALNPGGSLKWQYLPEADVLGSPAFAAQSVDVGSDLLLDTIVYLADVDGQLYGVRDANGEIWQIQRCSLDSDESCRTDSCEPDLGTCVDSRCTGDSEERCTPNTCIASNHGDCVSQPALLPVADTPTRVLTSPVLSGDLFVLVGTDDGRLCARALDGTVPGDEDDAANPWLDGCIELGDGLPVRSSPAIGPNGRIFVTTASGLYKVE